MSEHIRRTVVFIRFIPVCCAALMTGCATSSPNSPLGVVNDPSYLSPQYRGYRGPATNLGTPTEMGGTIQSDKPVIGEPDLGTSDLGRSDPEVAEEILPEPDLVRTPDIEPEEQSSGPMLTAPPLTAPRARTEEGGTPDKLQPVRLFLEIDKPEWVSVGGDVRYDITIRNEGPEPARDVVVHCTFDRGLVFPGKEARTLERSIGLIQAGESQTMSLVLVAGAVGRHCAQYTIKSAGKEAVWKSVCTDVSQPTLSVGVVGPAKRTVGGRAEYTFKIANAGSQLLKGVQVKLAYDDVLVAKEATAEAEEGDSQLSWNLGDLQPGEGLQLQVEFECTREAEAAKIQTDVHSADGELHRHESKLKIVPMRGVLNLRIHDQDDPVRRGGEVIYVVEVLNRGFQEVSGVLVSLTSPKNLKVQGIDVSLDGKPVKLSHQEREGTLTFEALDRMPAESRLQFRVRTKAERQGDGKFQASVKSGLQTDSQTVEEWTTVNE